MERTVTAAIVLSLLLACAGIALAQDSMDNRGQTPNTESVEPMTKDDVIALSKAGVSDDVIINQMIASGSYFQLTTDDIIDLEKAAVSEKVISAMVKSGQSPAYTGGAGSYYYPYDGYPLYFGIYPPAFFGFSAAIHRHFYGPRLYYPSYGTLGHYRSYRARGFGRSRSFGRHR